MSPIDEEKDRFCSRLSTIPGLHPLPSVGDWILLKVQSPSDLARKVNRRFTPSLMSVPRHIDGAVRLEIRDPKTNEQVLLALRTLMAVA